jgi:hypothetical protein
LYGKLNGEHVKFIVPEGLRHYYTEHNVQPSKEFYQFITEYDFTYILPKLTSGEMFMNNLMNQSLSDDPKHSE